VVPSARSAGPTPATRARRTKLVRSQLTVAVLVELLQRLARGGDFVGVDDPIVVEIEGGDDRRHWSMRRAARRRRLRPIGARRRSLRISARRWASRPVAAGRPRWHVFVPGEFTVAVFVESLQRGRSIDDLGGINNAVAIGIKSSDDR
jgi:hypothetical protein